MSIMKKAAIAAATVIAVAAPVAVSTASPASASPGSQAIGLAYDYLDTMPFSKLGLADQLEYEGFSHRTSMYAVNHIRVNWNKQAVKSANDYLDFMHFSCDGLIDQLEYEQYTHRQAVYGAYRTSAC